MANKLNFQAFQWIHAGAGSHRAVDWLAILFAEAGPYLVVTLFVFMWFLVGKNGKIALVEATEAALIGLGINQLIGLFYFHPRPYMLGLCTPLFPHGPETSFPSDHATLMFAATFYLLLVRHWAACGLTLLAFSVMTAWGRIYCGIHFPFDMGGSLVIGLVSAGLVYLLARPFNPLNRKLIQILNQLTSPFIPKNTYGSRKG